LIILLLISYIKESMPENRQQKLLCHIVFDHAALSPFSRQET